MSFTFLNGEGFLHSYYWQGKNHLDENKIRNRKQDPYTPLGPCKPWLPLGPELPWSPLAPGEPGNPGGPGLPIAPYETWHIYSVLLSVMSQVHVFCMCLCVGGI